MEDYEKLYQQSLVQIKKQKDQIRKLQDQIRERCQSYLIHSSRYRSRQGANEKSNEKVQSSRTMSEGSSKSQGGDPNQNIIQSNVVDLMFDCHTTKQPGVDEETETIQAQENNQQDYDKNASKIPMAIQQQEENQKQKVHTRGPPQHSQQVQNSKSQSFWEQVTAGLNQRIGILQKQKSDQAQKIIDLEQQIKSYKQEQKSWTESAMKKKESKVAQYSSAQKQEVRPLPSPENSSEEVMKKLFQMLEAQIDFSSCENAEDKINKIAAFVNQSNERQKARYNSLKQSKVSSYNFNSPYRKINSGNTDEGQMRDAYQQNEIEMLKRKCLELQMELTISRKQKDQSPARVQAAEETENIEQEIVNDAPYLIEQQLEKPNNPFVKRSFVRKKVVKRNLSAMILRSPSKSKEESKSCMINQLEKLKSHLEKSKDGNNEKEILSLSRKINKLQKNIEAKEDRIDEVSDDGSSLARASGISQDNFTQIIQVETEGPGFRNYTAHILGLNKKDNSVNQRKKKQNFYA